MVRILIIFFSFFLTQPNTQFEIQITGIKEAKCTMMIAVYQSQHEFLGDEAFVFKAIPVQKSENLRFSVSLPEGKYAISIYHDLNSDGELNTNILGIPKEPYGFSVSRGTFGPPSFKEASFDIPDLREIIIKIE